MRQETTSATAAIFAANRARGSVTFDVHQVEGVTRRRHLHEFGSLRVRFPSPEAEGLSAVFINTAGGVAGGDRFEIDITAREGSRIAVTTAAAEKVYRAEGPAAELNIVLKAAAGSHLSWLPQETILFDGARLSRRIDIELVESASLLLCEIVVFGRTAMGERMLHGELVDRWRLRRGGRLVFAETMRLDGNIGEKLSKACGRERRGGGRHRADWCRVMRRWWRECAKCRVRFGGEVGISTWNGFAMARFCAQDAARLRADRSRFSSRHRVGCYHGCGPARRISQKIIQSARINLSPREKDKLLDLDGGHGCADGGWSGASSSTIPKRSPLVFADFIVEGARDGRTVFDLDANGRASAHALPR